MATARLLKKYEANRFYQPYGAAEELFRTHQREVLMVGPSGTGKTRAVLEKLYLAAMKYPGCRILLTRATRVSMNESVLVTLENKVLPAGSGLHTGAHRNTRSSYRLANGSEMIVLGLDNVNRLMSSEYDFAAVFEATEALEDDWEKIDTRLRNGKAAFHQMIADCNPGAPTHWLRRRANAKKMHELFSMHQDNPTLTPEYIDSLSRLTGHRRARLFEGRWAAPEGLVYPQMSEAVVEPYDVIPAGRLIGAIDFGWNDPFVALGAVYVGESDTIHVFYERYRSKTPIVEHIKAIKRLGRVQWFCDPSRPDSIRDLRIADVNARPANNNILAGVDAVSSRLETGRLRISSECTAILAEYAGYAYPKDGVGEKPAPGMDHAMDALRYLVMAIDWRRTGNRTNA